MAALKLTGAKEQLNGIVFRGEFKDNSLHCFWKKKGRFVFSLKQHDTELGLQRKVLDLE